MSRPALFVSVGTDHHRFDRLLRWTDAWVQRLEIPIDYTVQHGASAPSRLATNLSMVPRPVLLDLISSSTIVVTQGGPGSIVDVRSCGRIPIVVPRLSRYNEVVDDHQVPFCALMAEQGASVVATDEATLHAWLDVALASPQRLRRPVPDSPAPATAKAVRRQLIRAIRRPSGWFDLARLREVWLRPQHSAVPLEPRTALLQPQTHALPATNQLPVDHRAAHSSREAS